jgi:glycosyltransferase involved in cell wall biosynthesis
MHILWIPHAGWHIPQRAHIFCRSLSERHVIHVTDWVADFASPGDYLSRRYLRNFRYRRYQDGRIHVHGIPRISPAIYVRLLRVLNTHIFALSVARIISRHAINVVVGSFLVPPPRAARIVFDLFDENVVNWRSSSQAPAYADEIERVEYAYLQTADAVVASSSVLVDKARALGTRGPVHLIPNGVDLQRFAHANGMGVRRQLGLQGRVVGLVGNNDKPAELDKVLSAAKALCDQELTFLIAGRGAAMAGAAKRACDEGLCNVRFLGYIPPDQVPDVLSALDVGLCPYAKTPMDDARSPMRLIAYAAAGLPTVCTDLVEVRRLQFPSVVLVDDSVQAFAEGIRCALSMPRIRPAQIEDYDINRLVKRYEAVLEDHTKH